MAEQLTIPSGADESYSRVLDAVLRWLPGYTDIVQAMPESAEQRTTLAAIEDKVANFLDELTEGRLGNIAGEMRRMYASSEASKILMKFRNPAHHDLLRRHMLALFAETGSVLEVPDQAYHTVFARRYLEYREQFGDIPEISRHIKIVE
jgi:hypothetical protein